jgi:hypothetical protein
MSHKKRPKEEQLARGGFNPLPAKTSKREQQVGPLPTDDPAHAKADDGDKLEEQKRGKTRSQ